MQNIVIFCKISILIFACNFQNEPFEIIMINGHIYWSHLLEIKYIHIRAKSLLYLMMVCLIFDIRKWEFLYIFTLSAKKIPSVGMSIIKFKLDINHLIYQTARQKRDNTLM